MDDRCESDISGVAYDSDLSHRSIGDVPIEAGTRSYKHRPNASLNTLLTTIALMALFGALGIGIGHYIGGRSVGSSRFDHSLFSINQAQCVS